MKNDRELLELAAKAAGYENIDFEDAINNWYAFGYDENGDVKDWWNPLIDDGDALRLAVKLRIDVEIDHSQCCVIPDPIIVEYYKDNNDDPCAATRKAIVRAAAEIGEKIEHTA